MGVDTANGRKPANVTIYLKTAIGKRPVDLSNETLVISYVDPYKKIDKLSMGKDKQAVVEELQGDGDTLIEYGELFKIVVFFDKIYGQAENVRLKPNDVFVVEIKPLVGALLKVERRLPPAIDPVMDLS